MKGTHNIGDVYTGRMFWFGFFQNSCLDIMLKKKITFGNTYKLDTALLKIISYILLTQYKNVWIYLVSNTRHPHFTNYLIAYKRISVRVSGLSGRGSLALLMMMMNG